MMDTRERTKYQYSKMEKFEISTYLKKEIKGWYGQN